LFFVALLFDLQGGLKKLEFCAIFSKNFKFFNFHQNNPIGGFLCEESIAHIPEPWKRFPDPELAYFRFNTHASSLNQGQGSVSRFSRFGNARNSKSWKMALKIFHIVWEFTSPFWEEVEFFVKFFFRETLRPDPKSRKASQELRLFACGHNLHKSCVENQLSNEDFKKATMSDINKKLTLNPFDEDFEVCPACYVQNEQQIELGNGDDSNATSPITPVPMSMI
jgi:hypothetical protein